MAEKNQKKSTKATDIMPAPAILAAPPLPKTTPGADIISDTARDIATRKLALNAKKQDYSLQLDGRKLDRALKLADGADKIAEMVIDPDVLERVKGNIKGPMDIKFLAEALKLISQELKAVERPDTDENGNRTPKAVRLLFKGKGELALEVPQSGGD